MQVICDKGNLITVAARAAVPQHTITLPRVLSTSRFDMVDYSLSTRPPEWYDGATGSVTGLRVARNLLTCVVEFEQTATPQALKSFAIVAADGTREGILCAFSDDKSIINLSLEKTTLTIQIPISLAGIIEEFGEVGDGLELAGEVSELRDDLDTLAETIAGEYISDLSYNEDTHILTATSANGKKTITLDLS